MHFDLSDDQRALGAAARDLLDKASPVESVRKSLGEPWDSSLWSLMVEQGWPTVTLGEDDGGLGMGWVEAAVLAEEVGRHIAPAPYTSAVLALAALESKPDLRSEVAEGATVVTVTRGGELGVDAPSAEWAIVVTDDVRLHRIESAAESAMDPTRQVGWVRPTDAGEVLGDAELATRLQDAASVVLSAEILGASARMLEVSTEYAKVREQFGKPIGSFQAIKHRLADMLVDVEGIRSATWYAAWALDAGADDTSLAASAAKAWASDAGVRVMGSALQVHGGIGFTWEHDLHLYSKRVHLDSTQWGSASWHRERIARLLADRVAVGADIF